MTRHFARFVPCAASSAVVLLFASGARAQALEPPPGYPTSGGAPGYPAAGASASGGASTNPAINTEEESKDSGLGLEWVYLNGDVGGGFASMDSFNSTTFGLQKTSAGGPAFGAAAGIRLLFFSVGLRFRDLQLSNIGPNNTTADLWELGGEAAFHVRSGHVDGYFGVRGGYNFIGSLNSSTVGVAAGNTSNVSIHGFNVGPMIGLDYYFAKYISIGVDADVQFLFLQRPQVPLPAGVTQADVALLPAQDQQLYNESGSSAGVAFVPTAHLGIHF
jgi:hypothetical protein